MKEYFAEQLLKVNAVSLKPDNPFTWSSGLRSPIYCDNRLTMSYPKLRNEIAKGMAQIIKDKYPGADLIAGTATAGIPHAAWVSQILELPMCYVRSKAKGHGKGNQIEGKAEKGQKAVVIEDLISTGGSVITAVRALREAGCEVVGVVSIFTYELSKGREELKKEEIEHQSLTDYSTLLEEALNLGNIDENDLGTLNEWKKDPAAWSASL
ncbi:orotate phosphoribosyltransferase [Falsibacillus pallidus]|uniref:Orotate phosphoribosyltransferase n=1 Tax=Falsibacillus pallidus TaxID=493781 RepID=A0A370GV23_9BACI|nr:orotate phosphoribosyltransferase [Falsibacillus pallidus]RDI47518.1 orotate phosphoribosyltransferase [Falsibacillus pallidus]